MISVLDFYQTIKPRVYIQHVPVSDTNALTNNLITHLFVIKNRKGGRIQGRLDEFLVLKLLWDKG